jgi:hypothetical protein
MGVHGPNVAGPVQVGAEQIDQPFTNIGKFRAAPVSEGQHRDSRAGSRRSVRDRGRPATPDHGARRHQDQEARRHPDQPPATECCASRRHDACPLRGDFHRRQTRVQLLRGRRAPGRLLLQQRDDEILQGRRDAGAKLRGADRLLVYDGMGHRDLVLSFEGRPSGKHLVEHHPNGPQIRPSVHRVAPDLLR